MTTGYKALQRVISESITPALERIILLLQHQQANRYESVSTLLILDSCRSVLAWAS